MSDQVSVEPLPVISFPGKIHLIQSDQELAQVAGHLRSAEVFGFDTETRPSFRKGEVYNVALLQLATEQNAFLVRLHGVHQVQILVELFENSNVIKVGAAIRDDLKSLQKKIKFTPRQFIELQDLAKAKGLKNFGLKGMTAEVLRGMLHKGPKTTNWEAPDLTNRQLIYAATDAWVGLKLFEKLRS